MPLLLLECRWGDLKPFLFCVLEALRYIYLKTKWEIQVYGNHQGFHESNLRASPVAMHPQCRFKPWNVLIKTVFIPGQHKIWSIIKRAMFVFCIECCSSSKKKPICYLTATIHQPKWHDGYITSHKATDFLRYIA